MAPPQPVWFITAASSGFGHAIATAALHKGHTVVATARNPARIADLAAAGAHTLAFDVTAPLPAIEATARDVFARHGRVDYLVNAAGYILEGAVEEVSPDEVQASFDTNVFGAMKTIRAFLPRMRAQPRRDDGDENTPRGVVVTFGSLGSWVGGASYPVYAMTKWAASALAESLRPEVAPFGIVASVVEPGYFRTNFLSAGSKVTSKQRIDAYDDPSTPSGQVRRALPDTDGHQLGDVRKGGQVIVDVLTQSGPAAGREIPLRIVLGSDCEKVIRDKCSETVRLLDEWKDVIRSTDYPEGQ